MYPQFRMAENPETRRLAVEAYDRKLDINAPLMDKMLGLRRKIASMLGYATWADYVTEIKMAKNAKTVVEVRPSPLPPCHFPNSPP